MHEGRNLSMDRPVASSPWGFVSHRKLTVRLPIELQQGAQIQEATDPRLCALPCLKWRPYAYSRSGSINDLYKALDSAGTLLGMSSLASTSAAAGPTRGAQSC
jgi:hypothetical protein